MANEKIIWNYFKVRGLTDAGIAGLMGNLFAESGLNPINLQNTFNTKFNLTDEEYTEKANTNRFFNFAKDGAGYGLAQWTYWSRKEKLLDFAKKNKKSVGDIYLQLDFLYQELNSSYKNLLTLLKTTQSVKEASNAVLLQFERPADQSIKVQNKRASYAQNYYNNFRIKKKINMKYNTQNPPIQCFQTNSTCYKSTKKMQILGVLWHSTGVNNPTLKRYIQPSEDDPNYSNLIKLIGQNNNRNDYNHMSYQSGLNAWIGKAENGKVISIQTMPWDYRPWGCGSGKKGSCNNGWIQFEICEDNLNNKEYFDQVYNESIQLTAYLCLVYNIDPKGYNIIQNTKIPNILCHADSYKLGFGSNHGDIYHWFQKYGKTMEDVRNDVSDILDKKTNILPQKIQNNGIKLPIVEDDDEDMTQEKFNEMMNNWIAEQAKKDAGAWSNTEREWAEKEGLVKGNNAGYKMYKKPITREEFIVVLYRALHRYFM